MMNPAKRLEQLQKRFGAKSVEESIAKMARSEALRRAGIEDIDLLLALCDSTDEPTLEQEAALNRYLAAYAAATVRRTAVPRIAPRAGQKGPNRSKRLGSGLPLEIHLRSEKARRSFRVFLEQAWPVLEPNTPFVPGIHIDAVCKHLQAIADGRIKNLIINMPPGHAKSLQVAVFWPAWIWIDHPGLRWLFASHKADLAIRDSVKCRRLIESGWYQKRWGDRFKLRGDQNEKARFENTATGYRLVTTVGAGTGERADIVVVDDPTSVDQAESDVERKTANEWWNGTMSTRLNDFKTGHLVVVQQRLHEDDLTGNLLEKGGYELLMLPEEYEPDRACRTSIGWRDPRTTPGELLWPEKNGPAEVEQLKHDLGSYRYAGQYQQRPSPAGGGIFKRWWWRYWKPKVMNLGPVTVKLADGGTLQINPVDLPDEFDETIQSWDMAFKDLKDSDYVAGGVWASKGPNRYLLDQRRERLGFPGSVAAVEAMTLKYPKATAKLVEDKANGPAVIATLKTKIGGLIAVNPEGGKIARANAVSPLVESGNVFLPHPAIAPWVDAYIEELAIFPAGRNDDQVDQTTQALLRIRTRPPMRPQPSYNPPYFNEYSWMA
jgi:predicted phage terminase large subunit-like protein